MRGISSVDPGDKEYEETVGDARKKWEAHMEAAMPCKKKNPSHFFCQQTVAGLGAPNKIPKTKYASEWNLKNPQERKWNQLFKEVTKTTSQRKGENCKNRYNLVHKFIPLQKAMTILDAKSSIGR